MSRGRRLGVLACALLVVLAGCGAQEVTRSPTATATPDQSTTTEQPSAGPTDAQGGDTDAEIRYRGEGLSFAAAPVFDRVESLLGVTAEPPTEVSVENASTWFGTNVTERRAPTGTSRFGALVGVETAGSYSDLRGTPNGATSPFGGVTLYPGNGSPAALEVVLAHEFVHVVQFQRNQVSAVRRNVGGTSTDARWTARSIVEGVAVWTETRYVETDGLDAPTGGERTATLYAEATPGTPFRHGQGAYRFGYDYVRNNSPGLDGVEGLYERPPTTSEQVLHGLAPGSEPPAELYVRTIAEGATWRGSATDTLGEAYARVVLENGVSVPASVEAAAGWGNDRLVTYRERPTANASFVWVTRWDTAADATEFRDAMNATFDAGGERTGDRWRLDGDVRATTARPDDATVVVTVGRPGLLDALAVSLDGSTVALTTNQSAANTTATADAAPAVTTSTTPPVTAETPPSPPAVRTTPRHQFAQTSLAPQTTTPERSYVDV
ncbi:hypothetical protein [Haloarchaeobius iranensis]|uniref:Uncharacterized protein n=1 Tax=Haloarchaeobius iranensis TaxID=996166 RepID=A0A1G9Y770_9EURY|nr:hypothetical protein [Haloarchaeobius iranensis]SDN04303.1 hypothetical protein SAMN05192554_11316 [Haloarchaeobius iranensis]